MKLDRHLIAHTRPLARSENVVFWRQYRVTVLQDRLFRIESNPKKRFRDGATQSVWFRDMPAQSFTAEEKGETFEIDTGACKLILRSRRSACTVVLDGAEKKLVNRGNLLGTYRTLDLCDAGVWKHGGNSHKIKLGTGVCSLSGVALFDDASSLTLGDDGEIKPERGEGKDEYVFVYGGDYRAAVNALYLITGRPPLVPRYALGNWWSRYHAYTDKEYLRLLNRFEERSIPLTVATIDMDWHYSDNVDEECGVTASGFGGKEYTVSDRFGWTGYTWNENLFPDYKTFLAEIAKKNLKITLNLHPAGGVRWWETQYREMCAATGRDARTRLPVPFDISDPQFINNYFTVLHRPYEADGVEFWWIDWQQGTNSAVEGLDPLWSLNHYHYLDSADGHAVPLILSRYSGIGSHRYPLGFSGDTYITYDTLAYLPWFTATASNVGYTWWSHDIGGHMRGISDGELYTRFVQYGVFSPINRLHCSCTETMTKEPWVYGNGAGEIAANFLRLRHRMIPYLYSCSYRTHAEGRALVEPLYYRHKEAQAYSYREEYYFGDLLVVPVTKPRQRDGYARVKAWIPEGEWTDVFTGDRYNVPAGGRETVLLRELDGIPVLAKAGTVWVLSSDEGNSCGNPERLEVRVYNGDGGFTLYEDGAGNGTEGELFTCFETTLSNGVQRLRISSRGTGAVVPAGRRLLVKFCGIPEGKISVFSGGEELPLPEVLCDCAAVELPFEADREYCLEAVTAETALQTLVRRAKEILLGANGDNRKKAAAWEAIGAVRCEEEYLAAAEKSDLPACVKLRLKEAVS